MTKATAWKWFSLYIRLRDSFSGGYVRCCTCSIIKPFREIQAGHYFTQGAYKRLVFTEQNCHAQCVSCNHYKSGNLSIYTQFMIDRYGVKIFDQLKLANRVNPRGYDYGLLTEIYKKKAKAIAAEKGVDL